MRRKYTRVYYSGAAPSRANWDPDQPRDCKICGVGLRITRDSVVMRRFPVRESFHAGCFA